MSSGGGRYWPVAVAAAIACWAAIGCSSSSGAEASGGQRQDAVSRLWGVVQKAAAEADGQVAAAEAVRTSEARGIGYVSARGPDPTHAGVSKTVWLVAVTGDHEFSCECTVRPASDGHHDGRYMYFEVDATTYEYGWGAVLLSEPLDLSPLGQVIQLHK